ncbi:hypothetical protein L0128_11365 [candidate division KSB1 bacterium]|nr:hypothetical protein [candidate division KSB1 bacterium]
MRKVLTIVWLGVIVGVGLSQNQSAGFALQTQARDILLRFCEVFQKEQIIVLSDSNYGAIQNPQRRSRCDAGGEVVFPLAIAYELTQQKEYAYAAYRLATWNICQQEPDGAWRQPNELPVISTTRQLLAMSLAYTSLKSRLSPKFEADWKNALVKAGNFLLRELKPHLATLPSNQLMLSVMAISALHQVQTEDAYRVLAENIAFQVMQRVDADGWLAEYLTGDNLQPAGIDAGASLGNSLLGLTLYSQWLAHPEAAQFVEKLLPNYLYFIYPDGSFDNSWGIFSRYWSPTGNFDVPGIQAVFGCGEWHDSRYQEAARQNLFSWRSALIQNQIPFGAAVSDSVIKPPPLLGTIRQAVNLALFLKFSPAGSVAKKALPADIIGWYNHFSTNDVLVVRARSYMATLSAAHFYETQTGVIPANQPPTGGVITNFWAAGIGTFQTSSPTDYVSDTILPAVDVSPLPLTGRIECVQNTGYYSNLYEYHAKMRVSTAAGSIVQAAVAGRLKNREQQTTGVKYIIKYTFREQAIDKEIWLSYSGPKVAVAIVEPFVYGPDTRIEVSEPGRVRIENNDTAWCLRIVAGEKYQLQTGTATERYLSPLTQVRAYPITIQLPPHKKGETYHLKYSIQQQPSAKLQLADLTIE